MKKKYDVHGTVPVVVHITVEAEDGEQAIEIAAQKFKGVRSYMGNGGCDKLIGVEKSQLLENKEEYSEEEWKDLFWKATQSQATAYRKQFKIAADACNIKYSVSTHSTRKTFGYWSVKLHPYDVTTVDKLQGIFSHSDRNTTLHYIGIAREDEIKLYNDMGDFVKDISNGKKPVIKNSPVVPLKAEDFREILSKCWDMAQNGEDKFNGINNLIGLAEKCMV